MPHSNSRWHVIITSSPYVSRRWILLQVGDEQSPIGYQAHIVRFGRHEECGVAKWIQSMYEQGVISHGERMRLNEVAMNMIIAGTLPPLHTG